MAMVSMANPRLRGAGSLRSLAKSSSAMISMSETRMSAGSSGVSRAHHRHRRQPPCDDRVDGLHGPLDAVAGAMTEVFDLAA